MIFKYVIFNLLVALQLFVILQNKNLHFHEKSFLMKSEVKIYFQVLPLLLQRAIAIAIPVKISKQRRK